MNLLYFFFKDCIYLFVCLFVCLFIYLFIELDGQGAEGRGWESHQAPCLELTWAGSYNPEILNWAKIKSWTLNGLSHHGAPTLFFVQ